MNTKALQTLQRVVTLGSFARVAEELNTSISTISMQMKSLEQELGVAIFDRSFRPPRMTSKGRLIAEHAASILNAERNIHNVCGAGEKLSGVYRIGFVATASVRILPEFLEAVFRDAPGARFEVETALSEQLEARVLAGQLDCAVLTETLRPSPNLHYQPLRVEEMVCAFPETNNETDLKTAAQNLPFLQFNPGSGIGKLIESWAAEHGIADRSRQIVLESVEAIMACVNAGLGFTMLAKPDVERYADAHVSIRRPEGPLLTRRLSLAVSRERAHSNEIKRIASLFD
ncbi:MAG: LysR family transcriptional regulator [Pseudomonadota bacterium]